ncbi:hypothetical protein Drorol1_Dr00020608, partial [Drosera rotundifolia]
EKYTETILRRTETFPARENQTNNNSSKTPYSAAATCTTFSTAFPSSTAVVPCRIHAVPPPLRGQPPLSTSREDVPPCSLGEDEQRRRRWEMQGGNGMRGDGGVRRRSLKMVDDEVVANEER